jgi:hypothetical protein
MEKRIVSLLLVMLLCGTAFGQKAKIKNSSKIISSTILTKTDKLSAELFAGNFYVTNAVSKTQKDTILIKNSINNNLPSDVKISNFMAKNKPLVLVTWTEITTTDTSLKKTTETKSFTNIYDFSTKSSVFTNLQTLINSKEIHFLDKKNTVSETIEKNQNAGFNVTLMPNSDLILKNKTQQNKMTFDSALNKYVPSKK